MGVFGYDKEFPIARQSLMSSRLRTCFNGVDIAVGTGFFIQTEDDEIFLVTNWHNVTGRDPNTLACISPRAAIPDSLVVECLVEKKDASKNRPLTMPVKLNLPLYRDEEMMEPRWKEHGVWKERVDVVLVPVTADQMTGMPEGCTFVFLERGDDKIQVEVGMDVAILGYPRGISVGIFEAHFPIWKRGAIASEPYHPIDDLPKFYIDSATREGMSGSPVFACASGPIRYEGSPYVAQSQGVVRRFLGVYSGRTGNDALGAQLGIVWKESVLAEILGFGIQGQSSVLLTSKTAGD